MKKILAHPLFRPIAFGVLFVIACVMTRMGFVLMVPIITNSGRYLINALPALLGCWLPLVSLIFLWMKWNSKDIARQWNFCFIYGLLITGVSALLLADQIILSAAEYNWTLHATEISPLFPFDVIALDAIFLGIGIFTLVRCALTKSNRLVERTNEEIKTRTAVAVWFFLPFTCYFAGATFSFATGLDTYDPNWPFMIPAFLSFFLMAEAMVLFILYKQGSEENKQKRHFLGIVIMLATIAVLGIWLGVGILVNPYLFPESLSQYYTLGYAIKIPFGVFFSFIGAIAPTIVSIVRYCKRYKVKK